MADEDVAGAERTRVADWIVAKADETEALLKLAAERSEGERAAWNKLFAIKASVILHVFAEMIRRNHLTLQSDKSDKDVAP